MIFHFRAENFLDIGVRILLDGEGVTGVVFADEEEGLVYCLPESPLAEPARTAQGTQAKGQTFRPGTFDGRCDEYGHYRLERRRGDVRIILPPRREKA